MHNLAAYVRDKLNHLDKEGITITDYARRRATLRQIDLSEMYLHLLNPNSLRWAERQHVRGEERFNCYFSHSNRRAIRIIIVFDDYDVTVINVIKLKRQWQQHLKQRNL